MIGALIGVLAVASTFNPRKSTCRPCWSENESSRGWLFSLRAEPTVQAGAVMNESSIFYSSANVDWMKGPTEWYTMRQTDRSGVGSCIVKGFEGLADLENVSASD